MRLTKVPTQLRPRGNRPSSSKLNMLFLESAIADMLVLLGFGTLCYWFLVVYFTGQTRRLRHIPTISSKTPLVSYLGAFRYLASGRTFIDECLQKWPKKLFRVPDLVQWTVIATDGDMIAELLRAPESTFSGTVSNDELVQMKYTLGSEITANPYHFPILRNKLRRSLPELVPAVHDEVIVAFNEHLLVKDDWTPIKFSEIIPKIVCQASNRIFVGYPLCRDPEFIDLNVRFTFDVFTVAMVLRSIPDFMRPLCNWLISSVPSQKRKALKYLGPVLDARRRERESKDNNDEAQKPLDMITWLMDAAAGEEMTNEALSNRILAINFGAIHTSSMTFTHAMYYLASYPAYAQALRDEVDAVVQQHGWSKAGLDLMVKVDSFMRESQRINPLFNVGLARIAAQDYTFSDGTFIPRGTAVAANIHGPHFDETIYENPGVFNPDRFVKANASGSGPGFSRRFDMTATSNDFLAFGNGKHACPGRYFAASELKLMLAYVVAHYDVKFENEGPGVRPADWWIMGSCLPNPKAEVLFRKRLV